MTDTPNLGLPFIEGSQAQKHVTHNEALRILDAAIQIAVRDTTRTTPPASPAEGQRHVVAAGASGVWAGHDHAIASWQDGAWAYLLPKSGWCVWSVAEDGMMVFDGTAWRALGTPALDSVAHLGINTAADAANLLSIRSNAALLAAIATADGGSGDVRLQLSRQSAANTASVMFSDNFSGRAEFGLVGSDAFKLKVSADGSSFVEAFTIDQATGNLALPRGLALTGVLAPPQITADQNDYGPVGLAAASVLQLAADAAHSLSGLTGGAEGRIIGLINVGGQPITLLDASAASAAANRFALAGNLTIAAKSGALLRYDGTAARWQALTGGLTVRADATQSLTAAQQAQARANAGAARVAPYFMAAVPADQSVITSSVTKAGCSAVIADSNGWYNAGSSRYTPQLAGKYRISMQIYGGGAGNISRIDARIYKNGSPYANAVQIPGASASFHSNAITATIDMNGSTDYVEPFGLVAATSPVFSGGIAPIVTFFEGQLIAP